MGAAQCPRCGARARGCSLLGGLWLFSSALFGGKVLAGDDLVLFTPPMSEVRPAGLAHPSNELNYDSAYVESAAVRWGWIVSLLGLMGAAGIAFVGRRNMARRR
jgi:hypothetical protein